MKTECPSCGNRYSRCGTHWSSSSCDIPDLSDRQKEILTGLLMGDGWVRTTKTASHPIFAMEMKNEDYIRWVAEELRPFTNKVVERDRSDESGVSDETYVVRMSSHPWLDELRSWYDGGKKTFPDDIDLTPAVLSGWYASDGYLKGNMLFISSGNEHQNENKICKIFEDSGLPSPYSVDGFTDEEGHSHGEIKFTVEDSKKIFDYMGEAPIGFEYKWPNND